MKHLRPGITWDGDVAFVNRRLRRYSNVWSVLGIAVLSVENIQKIIKGKHVRSPRQLCR